MGAVLARLPERDLRAALRALQMLAEQSGSASFIDAALEQLTGIVASDLTTLSICDLEAGHQPGGRDARVKPYPKPIARHSICIFASILSSGFTARIRADLRSASRIA